MTQAKTPYDRRWAGALLAVTLLGAALRMYGLARVPDNPFYDAAVRSMGQSLHNFFYGAFEPGASTSIDKPPVDLWLQVFAVKLLGFNSTVLKLPGAVAGTLAVPLLYDLVRRVADRSAALASATTLALLPVSVVTARSDTMDSVMMALLVGVAWLLVRAAQRGEVRWLMLAAALLGLDFNVKLFEALVPAPAFALFVWLAWHHTPFLRRLRICTFAGTAFVLVALSWLVAVSLTPKHDRPFALGSTHGSVWDATFVYNGLDRITQPAQPDTFDSDPLQGVLVADARPTPFVTAAAPAVSSAPAGALRLFERSRVDFGGLLGTLLFASFALGILALWRSRAMLRAATPLTRSAVAGLAGWLLTGYVLFSFSGRVHPRYLEAFTPAVAMALGISLSVLAARARDRRGALTLLGGLTLCTGEMALMTGYGVLIKAGFALGTLIFVMTAILLATAIRDSSKLGRWPSWCSPTVIATFAIGSLLAFPLARDVSLIRDHSGVQAASPLLRPGVVTALSDYLRAHQGHARYEFAASATTIADQIVVRDGRPILLLTTFYARPLVTLAQLRRDAAAGEVSYVLLHGQCPHPPYHLLPACSKAAEWVAAHGQDVTAALHLPNQTSGLLYRISSN